MPMIVTRQQAADHLRIDDTTDEANDLDLKIYAASAACLDYVEMDEDDFETDSDSDSDYVYPYQLQAAVLLTVGFLHNFRDPGKDSTSSGYTQANLPAPVRMLLYPLKTFGIEST